jgi:transposase-like protein
MARRKATGRKYTKAQKLEVLKRVQAGETQVAVAASSGVPLATVGYWTRKAKDAAMANGATHPKARRGRPVATPQVVSAPRHLTPPAALEGTDGSA